MNIAIFLIAAATAFSMPAAAQVFKCKDSNGNVVYSDSVCGQSAQQLNQQRLNSNTLDASSARRQVVEDRAQRQAEQSRAASYGTAASAGTNVCPGEQEIRNMETSLSSITLQGREKRSEREFLQAEVRRARACSKEGGNYTADDWKRAKEAQSAQNNISGSDRSAARATAESIHAPAASDRENDRMAVDRLTAAQREAEEARTRAAERARRAAKSRASDEPITVNCDRKGCWGSNGSRYNRTSRNTFVGEDGAMCRMVGIQLQCN